MHQYDSSDESVMNSLRDIRRQNRLQAPQQVEPPVFKFGRTYHDTAGFIYRNVTIPFEYRDQIGPLDRLWTEEEIAKIGISQPPGWKHYMIHATSPFTFCFRMEKPEGWQPDDDDSDSDVEETPITKKLAEARIMGQKAFEEDLNEKLKLSTQIDGFNRDPIVNNNCLNINNPDPIDAPTKRIYLDVKPQAVDDFADVEVTKVALPHLSQTVWKVLDEYNKSSIPPHERKLQVIKIVKPHFEDTTSCKEVPTGPEGIECFMEDDAPCSSMNINTPKNVHTDDESN